MHNRKRQQQAKAAAPEPQDRRAVLKDIELLRHAHKHIDPLARFQFILPDGKRYETTGAELIQAADHAVAMVDAVVIKDERSILKAAANILFEPELREITELA